MRRNRRQKGKAMSLRLPVEAIRATAVLDAPPSKALVGDGIRTSSALLVAPED